MSSQRRRITIGDDEYRVSALPVDDLVVHPDGSTEVVDDLDEWEKDKQSETDSGDKPFADGVCPMCSEAFESYMTHLQFCSGDR